jgi:hypothetical protein
MTSGKNWCTLCIAVLVVEEVSITVSWLVAIVVSWSRGVGTVEGVSLCWWCKRSPSLFIG